MKNNSRFAQRWMQANEALMDAIADQTPEAFSAARSAAILAIGASYTTPGCLDREMAESLVRMVADVAREYNVSIPEA